MKIFINHTETNKEQIGVNSGLNYGRFYNLPVKEYEIHLALSQFIPFLEEEYNQIKNELKQDDMLYSDTSEFTTTNYCSLKELINYPKDLNTIFSTYLDRILFSKLFPENSKNQYIINSTNHLKLCKDTIIITGKMYSKTVY